MLYLTQTLSVLYGALISFFLLYLLGKTNLLSSIIAAAYLPYLLNILAIALVAGASAVVWQIFGSQIHKKSILGLFFLLWLILGFFFYYGTII